MNFLLLVTVILIFGVQTLCFKVFSKSYMKSLASYFAFNFLYFCIIVAILPVFGIRFQGLHALTLELAILFGVIFVVSIYLYMKAMESGPLSLTSLCFSFGLLIPIIFGAIFWKETVSLLQAAALVLLFFTFYLGGKTRQDLQKKVNVKWLACSIAALIGNGALMTISKTQQMVLPGREVNEFLVLAFGTAAALSLLLFLFQKFVRKETVPHLKGRVFILLLLGTGITTAFGNQIALILSGRLPAVIQFPVQNGGIVFLSSALSVFAFREKMTRNAWIGLALGLAAMVLICL